MIRSYSWQLATLLVLGFAAEAGAIPATHVLTVYRFGGPLEVPYYEWADVARRGAAAGKAGVLVQGTSLVPCLVVRGGKPLTDAEGTPWVGFQVVLDPRIANHASIKKFKNALAARKHLDVPNHHCASDVRYVIGVRDLYAMNKAPFFDPPVSADSVGPAPSTSGLDAIVRAFHESAQCRSVQTKLIGRRAALDRAWTSFAKAGQKRWSGAAIARARHLDYAMRTALYEAHLDRGCSAYGACERNAIVLSLRNRAREACSPRQGCRHEGDIMGVSSEVSQYNIWDEVLTQISGLTSCFLRTDLASDPGYGRLQAMYEQSRPDVETILFGSDAALGAVFPDAAAGRIKTLRHYYHPPAMGKCFPGHPRLEYVTGAVARRGQDFALIANSRVEVGGKKKGGYEFRSAQIKEMPERDLLRSVDDYPGFLLDARKITLRPSRGCRPYGTPAGCRFEAIGRHRRVPSWLGSGQPIELICKVQSSGESCLDVPHPERARVGGVCDIRFQPIAGVP